MVKKITKQQVVVKLTCKKCKKTMGIRTHISHKHIYTAEFRKNYVCLLCRK